MNRPYTRDAFLRLVDQIRTLLPDCSLSTDVITGFCGETEEEHADTVSMMKEIGFDHAFMYLFSMRENTFAWRHFKDDVPLEVKKRRLTEIQDAFYSTLKGKLSRLDGKMELVLVEGESKYSKHSKHGKEHRCSHNYNHNDHCYNYTCIAVVVAQFQSDVSAIFVYIRPMGQFWITPFSVVKI